MLDECARERFCEASRDGSGRRWRRARVRWRAIAGEIDMCEGRRREHHGLKDEAADENAGIGRRRVGSGNHAATKHAAGRHVLLVRIAAGKLGSALMRADDIAEGVELRGGRPGREGAKRRLEHKHQDRDERDPYAPLSPPDVQALPLHAAMADT